jgi:hypothetical protein
MRGATAAALVASPSTLLVILVVIPPAITREVGSALDKRPR